MSGGDGGSTRPVRKARWTGLWPNDSSARHPGRSERPWRPWVLQPAIATNSTLPRKVCTPDVGSSPASGRVQRAGSRAGPGARYGWEGRRFPLRPGIPSTRCLREAKGISGKGVEKGYLDAQFTVHTIRGCHASKRSRVGLETASRTASALRFTRAPDIRTRSCPFSISTGDIYPGKKFSDPS